MEPAAKEKLNKLYDESKENLKEIKILLTWNRQTRTDPAKDRTLQTLIKKHEKLNNEINNLRSCKHCN